MSIYLPHMYQANKNMNHLQDLLVIKEEENITGVNKNVLLTKVLEEENFVSEFKNEKDYLMKYLTIDKLDTLLDYIFAKNLENETSNNKFRFPFIASEIFSSDNELIYNYLFETIKLKPEDEKNNEPNSIEELSDMYNKNRIEKIFDFYNSNQELNYTSAGYLFNIINNLISKKPEIIIKLMANNLNLIKNLLNHSYCSSVSNILGNLINFNKMFLLKKNSMDNDENEENSEIIKIQSQILIIIKEIFNIFLGTLDNLDEIEKHRNLFDIIMENLKELKIQNQNIKTSFYFQNETIDTLLEYLFNQEIINKNGLIRIFSLLIETVNIFKKGDEELKNLINTKFIEKVKNYNFEVNNNIGKKIVFSNGQMNLTSNKSIYSNLFLLQKIVFYLKLIDNDFDKILINLDLAPKLIKIYKIFPWNNSIHNMINKIFYEILQKNSIVPESIKKMFSNDTIIDFLNETKNYKLKNSKKCEIGYVIYAKKLYEHIIEFKNSSEIIFDVDFEKEEKWDEFKNSFYKQEMEKENFCLGDLRIEDSIDEDFEFTVDDIKKKFSSFLNIHFDERGFEIQVEEEEEDLKTNDQTLEITKNIDINPDNIINIVSNNNDNLDKKSESFDNFNYWKNDSYLDIDIHAILKDGDLL